MSYFPHDVGVNGNLLQLERILLPLLRNSGSSAAQAAKSASVPPFFFNVILPFSVLYDSHRKQGVTDVEM